MLKKKMPKMLTVNETGGQPINRRYGLLKHTSTLAATIVAIAAITAHAASEEDQSEPVALDTITVQGFGFFQEAATTAGSVAVLDSEIIEDMNLTELKDLNARIPGVTLNGTAGGAQYPYIRAAGRHWDPYGRGVVVNIDGVPQNVVELQNPAISGQIERIEVLKGPQHILYGPNALAGAINIYTRPPQETGGMLRLGVGNDGYTVANLTYNRAFNEQFLLGGTVGLDRYDGWIENVYDGSKRADKDLRNVSLVGVWRPTGNTTVTARAFGHNKTEGGPLIISINTEKMRPWSAFNPMMLPEGHALDFGQMSHNGSDETKSKVRGFNLTIEQMFDKVQFESVTGWQHYTEDGVGDTDGGSGQLYRMNSFTQKDNYLFSQNFRFIYDQGGALKWFAGVDAYHNRYDNLWFHIMNPGGQLTAGTEHKQQGIGSYGQLSWFATDHLELSLGSRYQIDKTEGRSKSDALVGKEDTSVTDKTLLFAGSVAWHFTDSVQTYLSVAQSYSPSGVNPLWGDSFKKETGINTEIGFKARWLDNRLYTAIALFESLAKNPYYVKSVPPYWVGTIGRQRNRGFEVEVGWQATRNLKLGTSYSQADPVIKKWEEFPEQVGNTLMHRPLSQANANISYIHDLSFGLVRSRLDINHMGKHYANNANTLKGPSYTTADLSTALEWGDQSLTLWGRNILDKEYYGLLTSEVSPLEAKASFGRGRTFGLTYQIRF